MGLKLKKKEEEKKDLPAGKSEYANAYILPRAVKCVSQVGSNLFIFFRQKISAVNA